MTTDDVFVGFDVFFHGRTTFCGSSPVKKQLMTRAEKNALIYYEDQYCPPYILDGHYIV